MIERACEEDVAFRVLAAQQCPDHATLARFIERHQEAIAGLFGEVLTLCARSGLAKVGVIAVDGTKLQANASRNENLDYEQLAREIIERSTRPRTSSMARRAATSCRRSSRLRKGRRGWLREAKQRSEGRARGEPTAERRAAPWSLM